MVMTRAVSSMIMETMASARTMMLPDNLSRPTSAASVAAEKQSTHLRQAAGSATPPTSARLTQTTIVATTTTPTLAAAPWIGLTSLPSQCAANAVVDALTKISAQPTQMEEIAQVTQVTPSSAAHTTSLALSSLPTSAAGAEVEHPTSPSPKRTTTSTYQSLASIPIMEHST